MLLFFNPTKELNLNMKNGSDTKFQEIPKWRSCMELDPDASFQFYLFLYFKNIYRKWCLEILVLVVLKWKVVAYSSLNLLASSKGLFSKMLSRFESKSKTKNFTCDQLKSFYFNKPWCVLSLIKNLISLHETKMFKFIEN